MLSIQKIEETAIVYEVKVEKEDMGKIIGKQGKVAQAIRTLIKSIGAKEKKKQWLNLLSKRKC